MSRDFRFDVTSAADGRVCVVSLAGKLDPLAVEELDPVIDRLYENGCRLFVLDLAQLVYIGSVGLRVFVGLANRVRADGYLGVCNVAPFVRQIFDLTKVTTLLRIFSTQADALDAALTL